MPEVLSLYQLAGRLHLSADWLRSEAEAGRLPHLRAGKRLLFNLVAVTKTLASMAEQTPTAQPREVPHAR